MLLTIVKTLLLRLSKNASSVVCSNKWLTTSGVEPAWCRSSWFFSNFSGCWSFMYLQCCRSETRPVSIFQLSYSACVNLLLHIPRSQGPSTRRRDIQRLDHSTMLGKDLHRSSKQNFSRTREFSRKKWEILRNFCYIKQVLMKIKSLVN